MASQSELLANGNALANKLLPADRAAHDWYRFVLSYPPHLVREYLKRFSLGPRATVLDPFCGTGTTLVECKKAGIPSIGVEANPMPHFASAVKTDWTTDGVHLRQHAESVADDTLAMLHRQGIEDENLPLLRLSAIPSDQHVSLRGLPAEQARLLLCTSAAWLGIWRTCAASFDPEPGWRMSSATKPPICG